MAQKAAVESAGPGTEERERVFEAYRRWGYLAADLDPLGFFQPSRPPELPQAGEAATQARQFYCGTIGAEFMHIADAGRRNWLAERLETDPGPVNQQGILERLVRADLFEQVLQTRYVGTKRFSLEGVTSLVPLLDEVLETAGRLGAEQAILAVSHRGRLNIMTHIVGRPAHEVAAGFEDVDPRSVLGAGDVKYHVGATGAYKTASGATLSIHLVSNPSHLEAVDPVALGRARAKQTRIGAEGRRKVLPVLLHGDAAFAGQGIWAETLNLADLEAYTVGGAVHIVVNNLIGFTTRPNQLHSSLFASDLAKRQAVPVIHVNAEDPEAVVRVGRLAAEYRYTFGGGMVIDLIGYRRHGHSEVDDPTITQPLLYKRINAHRPLWETYARRIGAEATAVAAAVRAEYEDAQKKAETLEKAPSLRQLPRYWSGYKRGRYDPVYEVDTGMAPERLAEINERLARVPEGFQLHPKIARLLEQRKEMGRGKRPVDFGFAEALAFASLLLEGNPVRLAGQDSERGTFNQRHAVLVDAETEETYVPLAHLAPGQPFCEIHNSTLSEAGCLGYEYGFSRDYPEALVLWEAQFGDFANGAQVIIDQFISAGEDKWDLPSGVVLLLPHGYEGQGPEHSSARMERFLQLAAEDNLQVCQPSTAAQYFHLLRRQVRRPWRKPLVVFTPKGMLRHPAACSAIEEFSRPRFLPLIGDSEVHNAERILMVSGKLGHELKIERQRRGEASTAILSLEQLYPLPRAEIAAAIEQHGRAREVVWVQEEPGNMGASSYVVPRLRRLTGGRPVRVVRRSPSASPATGSPRAHELEQRTLLTLAFATRPRG